MSAVLLSFLLFLAFIPLAAAVASQCPDELRPGARIAKLALMFTLLAGAALLLYPLVPLWAQLCCLALAFLAMLRFDPAQVFLLALAPLLALASLVPSQLSLAAQGLLLIGALALGALLAQRTWRKTLFVALRALVPYAILAILIVIGTYIAEFF